MKEVYTKYSLFSTRYLPLSLDFQERALARELGVRMYAENRLSRILVGTDPLTETVVRGSINMVTNMGLLVVRADTRFRVLTGKHLP